VTVDFVAIEEFLLGIAFTAAATWMIHSVRQNRRLKVLAFTQNTPLHPWLGEIEIAVSSPGVEPEIVVDVLGTTQEIEMIPCPVCGLVMPDDVWRDHAEQTGHALKKYDVQAAERGIGMVRLVLKSGDRLPEEFEHDNPILTETEGETLIYWFRRTGLKRIR